MKTDAILFQAEQEYGIRCFRGCSEMDCKCLSDQDFFDRIGGVPCKDECPVYEPEDYEMVDEFNQAEMERLERANHADDFDTSEYDLPLRNQYPEPQAHMPAGWVLFIDCNSPGRVYMGPEENYDYHDINGYSPVKVSWRQALVYLSVGEGDGKWSLEVCGSISDAQRREIVDFNKRWRNK